MSDPTGPPPEGTPVSVAAPAPAAAHDEQPSDLELLGVWAVCVIVVLPALATGMSYELAGLVRPSYLEHLYYLTVAAGNVTLVAVLTWRGGITAEALGLGRPRWATDVGLSLLLTGATWVSYTFILSLLSEGARPDSWYYHRGLPMRPVGALSWVLASASAIAIGFAEELVFRGYLLTRLERVLQSPGWAVVVSSVAFGGCHLYQGFSGAVGAATFGALMALGFLATRRLWPVALAHSLYGILVYLDTPTPEFVLDLQSTPTSTGW
jgi:membrane protease YdiL (CAAX protease family)